jgi:hypothetical protein
MAKGYIPSIFVSSTCYDLNQIRMDLKEFIISLGYQPVMSEFASFPVNPDFDNVGNCVENVKNRADILVLIIGGRYGSQTNMGKSITNIEYLEAKRKGIPVYIFVLKPVLNLVPIWKKNPDGDYSDIVETPKLFEFIETIKNKSENWVYAFENAQDITRTLKQQLAYLFSESLDFRQKVISNELIRESETLSPKALSILIQKPDGWEYLFFAQVLIDEYHSLEPLRFDLKYLVSYGTIQKFDEFWELFDWLGKHQSVLSKVVESLSTLMNKALAEAFGEDGVEGDSQKIIYVARRITEGYKNILNWTLDFRKIDVDEEFEHLVYLASQMSTNVINEFEVYIPKVYNDVNEAVLNHIPGQETAYELILKISIPDMSEYLKEMERLGKKYSS